MSPALLKFHINSMHDVANTPANMKLWNYADTGNCTLCGWRSCNIKHILAVCHYSLNNRRFNWRHDNVLRVIAGALLDQLNMYNSLDNKMKEDKWVNFKSSKGSYRKPHYNIKRESSFDTAKDWKMLWDEDQFPVEFPQNIYNTSERPDIVVWSEEAKEVILIELTVGDEGNFSDQVVRKEARYNRELIPGITATGWKARLFTIEVSGTTQYLLYLTTLGWRGERRSKHFKMLLLLLFDVPTLSGWHVPTGNGLQATTLQRGQSNHQWGELSVGPLKHCLKSHLGSQLPGPDMIAD